MPDINYTGLVDPTTAIKWHQGAQVGIWGYSSGTGTTTIAVPGRLIGFSVYANAADCTMTINGGNTVTVRSGASWSLNPKGLIPSPSLIISTAQADWFVEYVA